MANNYTEFAVEFPFPEQAARDFMSLCSGSFNDYPQWFIDKHQLTEDNIGIFIYEIGSWNDIFSVDGDFRVITNYNRRSGELYIASEESGDIPGDIAGVAYMLSQVMEHYKIKKAVVIEAAFTCSKMSPYEFGGTVVVIGPGMYKFKSTYDCSRELLKEMGLEEL